MWSALTGLVKSLNDNQSVFGQFLTTMHTDNTEPEVSVGLHGTIKESSESESESKYSRSYERSLIETRSVNIEDILMFRVDARINALTVVSN